MSISSLRSLETKLIKDGSLSAKDVKELTAAAKTPEEKAVLKDMFAHDMFDSSVKTKPASKQPTVVGQAVGSSTVARTFGPLEGYSNKFQAISTALTSGAQPVAVMQDPNTKQWHAVQPKDALTSNSATAFALNPNPAEYEKAKNISDPKERAEKLLLYGLGVPKELINVGTGITHFDKNKINVNLGETTVNGRAHVHNSECACGKNGAAIELSPGRLNDGREFMMATLAHEGQHAADDDMHQAAAAKFAKTGGNPKDIDAFKGWLRKQPEYTKEQANSIALRSMGTEKNTEGSAYMAAFKTMIGTNREAALDQLLGFVSYENGSMPLVKDDPRMADPHKQISHPAGGGRKQAYADQFRIEWKMRDQMINELKDTYAKLPEDKKADFEKTIAIAEQRFAPVGANLWKPIFGDKKPPAVNKNEIPTGIKREDARPGSPSR